MARKQLSALDMTGLEILNVRAQNLASAPGSPTLGQFWFNTSTGKIEFKGTSAVIDPTARSNHTGTQLAATISDFDTQVRTSRLDQMAAPTASLPLNSQKITGLANGSAASDAAAFGQIAAAIASATVNSLAVPISAFSMNSQKITNLANGSNAQDACTYGQLQAAINGVDWKQSVRVVATTNLAALSGLLTIDGVTVVANDRVLVAGQTTASANGIYVAASGAWSRAADAVDATTLTPDASVFVEEGTTYADTQWRLTANAPIVIGTTNLTWAQIGAATSYTNGAGLNLAGNVFSLDTTVAVRKYAATFGDGAALSYALSHGLSTLDVTVGVYQVSDGAEVSCDITRTSASVVTVAFAVAPASNSLRAVVHG